MHIREDDLQGPEIIQLLQRHIEHMHDITPRESIHAMDVDALRDSLSASEMSFWSIWEGGALLGCGALKELDAKTGEVKSMRTADEHWGKGVASSMLEFIIREAETRQYKQLLLETGAFPAFAPARALYEKYGFTYREPFADYKPDPNSVFMSKKLS